MHWTPSFLHHTSWVICVPIKVVVHVLFYVFNRDVRCRYLAFGTLGAGLGEICECYKRVRECRAVRNKAPCS